MKKSILYFILAGLFLLLFAGLILGLCQTKGSAPVGFSSLNQNVFETLGYKPFWYTLTEYLGVIPLFVAACFAGFGLGQWYKRKSLKQVDKDLFCLAGLYAATAAVYCIFEGFVLNLRPVLINDQAEASFPSSHTVLVCVIMFSAALQIRARCPGKALRITGQILCYVLAATVTVGRLLSGVHWLTDIIGGLFISVALVLCYCGAVALFGGEKEK